MTYISNNIKTNKLDKNKFKKDFVPAGQTTQLIIALRLRVILKY